MTLPSEMWPKTKLEFLRTQARQKFDTVRGSWIEQGYWALPYATKWLRSQREGELNNKHIVDPTHVTALRSYVAGFLEGNTSASRPWFRVQTGNDDVNMQPENHKYLDALTMRALKCLGSSNYYNSAGMFYYHFGTFNTGAHYIDEGRDGELFFHNLIPGSYYVLCNAMGEHVVLVREMSMTVMQLVNKYGKRRNGTADWSNISANVRKMYEDGNYAQLVDVVSIIMENEFFDPTRAIGGANRKWVAITYEAGRNISAYNLGIDNFGAANPDPETDAFKKYLMVSYSKRKPFIVGVSDRNGNFEYGEKGPTSDALGLIKSLNKKAISKDMALEQMIKPAMQGPANLRKSYITTAANSFVPLDAQSLAQGGLKPVAQIGNGIGELFQDQQDLRQQVGKIYYEDFLLYLTQNPKTRTATETSAIVQEQQLVIGPALQALNWTYNVPLVEFVIDFVLDNDPNLPDAPAGLQGKYLRPEFVSVFAQAMKAADLPSIDRYIEKMMSIAQLNPKMWDKVNLDRYADLYEDRLFLPAGLNNPQAKVDALRQQAQAQAERQQHLQETLPAVAQAAKNMGVQVGQQQNAPQGAGDQGQ